MTLEFENDDIFSHLGDDIQDNDNFGDPELDDDDNDEEEDEIDDKIGNYVEKDIFQKYHPTIKQINNQELQMLIKIKRNEDGLIEDENHRTIPILTRYEKSKIIGLRAKQINAGSELFIDAPANIIDGITLAEIELKEKKIPFIIRRPLPLMEKMSIGI